MVEVKVAYDKGRVRIEMNGHSGYGKKGEDIVCAGISGVLQFVIIHFFNNLRRDGNFKLSNGVGFVEVMLKEEDRDLISSFIEYLKLVEKSYPNSLRIDVVNK
ncbi:MAG: ribosomal-processing cysteine protease Prp [Spirochaetia bacterium]|nr:ribosomal-processing cysteine protease Prp [Spirochaetota bacterium]MCX8097351.1 ribosomal-processing cysteine protease Prp [Spirochaetota bacterium]MDW8112010.1 ribosomal-processing cysteine protease Prp [Spirochaetia bacterium]